MYYEAFVLPALHNFMDLYWCGPKIFDTVHSLFYSLLPNYQKVIYLFLFSKPTFWNGMILRICFFLKNYFPRNKKKKIKVNTFISKGTVKNQFLALTRNNSEITSALIKNNLKRASNLNWQFQQFI